MSTTTSTEVKKPQRPRSVAPSTDRDRDRGRNRGASPGPRSRAANKDARRGRSLSPAPTTATATAPKPKAMPPSYYDMDADLNGNKVKITKHQDDDTFLEAVKRCIPSEFIVIASQDDVSQAQEDYFAMDHFQLEPPQREGKTRWSNSEMAGSVATCALLQLMQQYPDRWVATNDSSSEDNSDTTTPFSTLEILHEIQSRVKSCSKQDANPTITSSRPLGPPRYPEDVFSPFYIVPPTHTQGTRRALLIACVSGEEKDLQGTINDVNNIQTFLLQHCGFQPEHMTVLQETYKLPNHQQPTKKNITTAFKKMVQDSQPGDVNFIQFSGHGNRSDTNLYILPSDYKTAGNIQDERILKNLIKAMPGGVYTTFLCDCCYSGTIGDLPYILKTDSTDQIIETKFDTSVAKNNKSSRGRSRSPPRTTRPNKRMSVQQSIRTFYDIDTREETLEKEATGGEEYKKLQEARKKKNLWENLDSKSHFLFQTAKKAGNAAIDAADQAIEGAIEAAKKTKTKLRSLSPLRNRNKDKDKGNKVIETLESSSKPKTSKDDPSSTSLDDEDKDDDVVPAPKTKANSSGRSKSPTRKAKSEAKPASLVDDDVPVPAPKTRVKAKAAVSESSSRRSKSPTRKASLDDDDVPTPTKAKAKDKDKSTTSTAAVATKPATKKSKSPMRKAKSLDSPGAPTAIPTTSTTKKKKVMKDNGLKSTNEEEEFEEFEKAVAKATSKEKKPATKERGRGRTTSRSNSPAKTRI